MMKAGFRTATRDGAGRSIAAAQIVQRFGVLIALLLLCLVLSFANEYFMTGRNLVNVLRQVSINGILAIGMTFVILTRGIDLSVGSIVALSGLVASSFATTSAASAVAGGPYPAGVALAVGLGVGAATGAVSGLLIARFRVAPFVVTLGMLSAARGLTLLYAQGRPIPALTEGFRWIGTGTVLSVPVPVLLFLAVALVAWYVLGWTRYGRQIYAVGGNPHAAVVSGINLGRMHFSVYVISGALAGLAGMVLAARTGSALPQAGLSYELDAIAAVVIGGTSLAGGIGTIGGTLVGALLIGVVNNGLDLLGVESYYQQIIKGALIVAAVLLDQSRTRKE